MVRGKLCTAKGSSQFTENIQEGHKQTSRAMPLICVRLKPEETGKGLFVLRLLLPSSSVFETFFLLSALKIPFCQQPPVATSAESRSTDRGGSRDQRSAVLPAGVPNIPINQNLKGSHNAPHQRTQAPARGGRI